MGEAHTFARGARLRRGPQVLVTLALVAAIAGACAVDVADGPADADASVETSTVAAGICPDAAPEAGEACLLPEGTTCAFGACATPIAECTQGAWRYGGNPPPRPPCPDPAPPPAESACPPCWPAGVTCGYGSCIGPDASANRTVASCPSGTWTLLFTPCPAQGSDAGALEDAAADGVDAGADVQRDADEEAD